MATEGLQGLRGDEAMSESFWDDPEIVERFADRPPDERLRALIEALDEADLSSFRVLDLGCAGGRNTRFLAERGVDVHALDASRAMVDHTRARVAEVLGAREAEERVVMGSMSELGRFDDHGFDLVVALGVIQSAQSLEEWDRTLSEVARVLRPGGRILVANFAPDSRPEGRPLEQPAGTRHVFLWRDGRPMVLMDAAEHDDAFAAHGFHPVDETETVRVSKKGGYRFTVNAFYELGQGNNPPVP